MVAAAVVAVEVAVLVVLVVLEVLVMMVVLDVIKDHFLKQPSFLFAYTVQLSTCLFHVNDQESIVIKHIFHRS